MSNPIYSSVEDLQQKVDDYFNSASEFSYTITGLILALGFGSRQSFYNYLKKPEFSYALNRAKLRIENSYEAYLRMPEVKPTGAIFALKSMGWNDTPQAEDSPENKVETLTEYDKDDFIRRFKEDY